MLLIKTNRKLVDIYINEVKTELVMKLGSAGEAYFVEQTDEIGEDDIEASSPIQSESGEAEPEDGSDK
jgi:phosphatidate phosphatase LPIN